MMGQKNSTYTLYISPLFNNNVFCYEILWIYTTMGTLHTDTLKTILRRVKQYRASVIGLTYPPYLVIRLSLGYERLMSSRFGINYYCPPSIRINFQNFGA